MGQRHTGLMADNKTAPSENSVADLIEALPQERRRAEARTVVNLLQQTTGEKPVVWGPSMIGFGTLHYTYESGREGDTARVAFAARKSGLTFYGLKDHPDSAALFESLGSYTEGVGCVYVKSLDQIDQDVLADLVRLAWTR